MASLHRQALRTRNELSSRPDPDHRVPDRDSLEVVVVGDLGIEEVEVAIAVENYLSVPGAFDYNRLLRGASCGQIVGTFHRSGGIDGPVTCVVLRMVFVKAGMHQDGVAGFDPGTARRYCVAPAAVVVVGTHEPVERRLKSGPFIVRWVNVVDLPSRGGHRLGAGPHLNHLSQCLACLPHYSVGIRQDEAGLVASVRLQVQNASGKHVRRDYVEDALVLINPFTLEPHQGQALFPAGLALFAVQNFDGGVPVIVALDYPFEAQID